MVKLILATLVCAFIASPALASEFRIEQTKMLNNISMNMEEFTGDTNKLYFLTQKKICVENATDINNLKECIAKFQPDQLEAASTVSQ
jgi:hypothetical protein